MNKYTFHENVAAERMRAAAAWTVSLYCSTGDEKAATVALLVEALILAGGQHFLKPTEENT